MLRRVRSIFFLVLLTCTICKVHSSKVQNITAMIEELAPETPEVFESNNDDATLLEVDNEGSIVSPSLALIGYAIIMVGAIFTLS